MRPWDVRRGVIWEDAFIQDSESLGIATTDFDDVVRTDVENLLTGAEMSKLDEMFPVLYPPDLRLLFTAARPGVPALRIAWRIATDDHDKIDLLRCSLPSG